MIPFLSRTGKAPLGGQRSGKGSREVPVHLSHLNEKAEGAHAFEDPALWRDGRVFREEGSSPSRDR